MPDQSSVTVRVLVLVVRKMHARLASISDIEEIAEETMQDLGFTPAQKAIVRAEIR